MTGPTTQSPQTSTGWGSAPELVENTLVLEVKVLLVERVQLDCGELQTACSWRSLDCGPKHVEDSQLYITRFCVVRVTQLRVQCAFWFPCLGAQDLVYIMISVDSNVDGALDFAEFMRVFRKLQSKNWQGINEKVALAQTARTLQAPHTL
eukprot:2485475-Amphidinium_carterae.2